MHFKLSASIEFINYFSSTRHEGVDKIDLCYPKKNHFKIHFKITGLITQSHNCVLVFVLTCNVSHQFKDLKAGEIVKIDVPLVPKELVWGGLVIYPSPNIYQS